MKHWKQKLSHVVREHIAKAPAHLPYIFIIGFNKTATTTLHFFFEKNGLPSVHWDNNRLAATMISNCLNDRRILKGYDRRFRVFSDMIAVTQRMRFEANSLFRILDRDYPGSYFIYNNRDTQAWLASRWKKPCGKYGCTNVELEMQILNTTDPQEVVDTWNREKTVFEENIRRYFAGNDRFLEFDIKDPEAPQRIADLLGMPLDPTHWEHHRTNRPRQHMRDRITALGPCPTPRG
jgi:hypothetical protein